MKPISPNDRLAEVIDREAPTERIIQTLADALAADTVNRDGSRSADHRQRVIAALALLEYRVGRPVTRSEVVTVALDADAALDIDARLAKSPALLANLEAAVARARKRQAIEV